MSLGNFLAENLLVLLSFDDKNSKLIRGSVDASMFGGPYRDIAARIYDFIDRHKEAPKDHLADILEDKLESKNKKEAELYADIVENIHDMKDRVNTEYVVTQLETFVKRQSLRTIAIDLAKALQRDTEDSLEEADNLIKQATQTHLQVFDPGTRLSDHTKSLRFLDADVAPFLTGIPEFDRRGFGPTRKEMYLYLADTKTGKTWWLNHLAKISLMHKLRVCHITLEMSEAQISKRYFQVFFAISKRNEQFSRIKFERDKLNRITGHKEVTLKPALSFDDPNIHKKLRSRIDKWSKRVLNNIYVKQFPTSKLTPRQLEAYLDNLEASERFVPDLLIIDYPDLMYVDKSNPRISIDEIFKNIRGIAVERNMALATVTQSNRAGSGVKKVTRRNVSEDYGKIAHSDCTVTYSQTEEEKRLGLARLSVEAGRNDEDGFTVVISQCYNIGQFVLDSNLLIGNYWDLIGEGDE